MFNKHQLMHINFIHNSLLLKFPYMYFGGLTINYCEKVYVH
jgi:hypothetical protein